MLVPRRKPQEEQRAQRPEAEEHVRRDLIEIPRDTGART